MAKLCTKCLFQGTMKKDTPGSFLIEVILWLAFIVPGIIYSIWRLSNKKLMCPQCKSSEIIPADSEMAKRLLKTG
jgi:hypothetical protein